MKSKRLYWQRPARFQTCIALRDDKCIFISSSHLLSNPRVLGVTCHKLHSDRRICSITDVYTNHEYVNQQPFLRPVRTRNRIMSQSRIIIHIILITQREYLPQTSSPFCTFPRALVQAFGFGYSSMSSQIWSCFWVATSLSCNTLSSVVRLR